MRIAVRNVAFRGVARNAIALAIALSGLPIAVLNALHVVPGHPMLSVVLACALAAAVGFAPSSGARGREGGFVEVDGATLRIEIGSWRHAWATRDVTGAWTELEGMRVVLRDRVGRTLAFDAATAADAEGLLEAAALGPGVRVTRIPIGGATTSARAAGLMFGSLFFTALGLLLIVGTVRLLRASDRFGIPLPVVLVFGGVAYGSLRLARRCFLRVRVLDVAVGRDGVLVPQVLGRARRISLDEIVSTDVADNAITITTKRRPLVLRAANRQQARALADAISEAMSRYTSTSRADRTILQRDGRSAAEWTAHLRDLAGRARTYRSGFELADLIAIAEDPVTSAEDRVAAALIVARIDDQHRPRLRIAAEGTVDGDLRAAMLSAVEQGIVEDDALRGLGARKRP